MNISVLLCAIAACNVIFALWAVSHRSREGVLANVGMLILFVTLAMVVHPYHAKMIEASRVDIERQRIELETERLSRLSAVLGSGELAVRYLEVTAQAYGD